MSRRRPAALAVVLGALAALGGCNLIFPFSTREAPADAPTDAHLLADADATPADGPLDADLGPGPDGAQLDVKPEPDGPHSDLEPKLDAGVPCGTIGVPCTASTGAVCGAGVCVITEKATGQGVCSCACTPDDLTTLSTNEDTCPDLTTNICARTSETDAYCFQKCAPKLGANDCKAPLACVPDSHWVLPNPESSAVCALTGCVNDLDCPVITSTTCSGSSACAPGQICVSLYGSSLARCALPGVCDTASGLCSKKPAGLSVSTAKVGDPCTDDTQCGESMLCLIEHDTAAYLKKAGQPCAEGWECCSGSCSVNSTCAAGTPCTVRYRNGYCSIKGCRFASTLSIRACPTGSLCSRLYSTGLCQLSCDLTDAATCRNQADDLFGDYECRDWSNFGGTGGGPVAPGPVCDFGTTVPCSFFGAGGSTTCVNLGLKPNVTYMGCRTLDNKATASAKDPGGFCLDDTSSGTLHRSPLPTP
jgi:hypothetical protein